jgi:hypothetical protein
MARRIEKQQPVRKSFLIFGGVVIGAAVLAFVLMTFVFGGGGAIEVEETPEETATSPAPGAAGSPAPGGQAPAAQPTPTPTATPYKIQEGGRDPFIPQAGAAPAATPAPVAEVQPASFTNDDGSEPVTVAVLAVYGNSADVKLNKEVFEGAKAGQVLTPRFSVEKIEGECVILKEQADSFKVCKGKNVKR